MERLDTSAMTDPIREAFERYYESHFKSRLYMNMARTEWAFWKASRREALREAAEICERSDGWDMNPKDYAKLLRAAAEEEGK